MPGARPGYAALPACSLGEKRIDWKRSATEPYCFEQLSLANTSGQIRARFRLPMLYCPRLHAGSDAYPGRAQKLDGHPFH
jgi:hypothetical protein